jgi:dCMP deaminase
MKPEREEQLKGIYMDIAVKFSEMSYATRAKVGALLVRDDNILSYAWNGMPSGFPNDELEFVNDKGQLVTSPIGLHAESNALSKLLKTGGRSSDATMYVTMSPCPDCAKLIIQAGIKKVFYMTKYRLTEGLDILRRAKIPCKQLSAKKVHDVHPRYNSEDDPVEGAGRNEERRSDQAPKPSARKKPHRPAKGHL